MIFVFVSWFNTSNEKSCSHGHVTSVIEGLQNVGLCCTAFVQEGIFIVSHVIYTWHKSMRSFPKYHPGLVAFDNKQGTLRIYSKLIPTRLNIIEIYMKHLIKINKINSVLFRNKRPAPEILLLICDFVFPWLILITIDSLFNMLINVWRV